MALLIVVLASVLLSWSTVKWLIHHQSRKGIIDIPNERSSHDTPTPRGGGLGLLVGIAGGAVGLYLAGYELPTWPFWVATLLVALSGYLDDRAGGLSVKVRLTMQLGAAALVVGWYGGIQTWPIPGLMDTELGLLGWGIALVWVVGVTNIFNFLDGIDGYAGAQAALAGAMIGFLGGAMGWVIVGASLGFLWHNWHPARIFMGDVGSAALGFGLAAWPLAHPGGPNSLALWGVGIALWFFLADGASTILKRLLKGEKVWMPHRTHLYQRLTIAGWRHDKVVWSVGSMALVLGAAAVWAVEKDMWAQGMVSGGAFVLFGLYVFVTHWAERETTA